MQVRIEAIALVHRNIYLADEVEYVNLQDLVPTVAHQVLQFFDDGNGRVALHIEAEAIWLTVDRAIPVSQFIVEALSNSYGHAFPDERGGQVAISLRCDSSGQACLTVADNGIGLPPKDTVPWRNHIGHELMQSLARQIGGSAEMNSLDGTQAILRFTYRSPDIAPAREKNIGLANVAFPAPNTGTEPPNLAAVSES
jgi:two-component sensor histidine kinase